MEIYRAKSGKMLIPIIIGVLVLVAVGGVAFMKFKGGPKKHGKEKPVAEATSTMDLGEMVVNLADTKEPHYLKIKIVLEGTGLSEGGGHGGGESTVSPKMRDAVIACLSARTFGELLTPEGKETLKKSIKDTVNKTLGEEAEVTEVFFSDFAMQ